MAPLRISQEKNTTLQAPKARPIIATHFPSRNPLQDSLNYVSRHPPKTIPRHAFDVTLSRPGSYLHTEPGMQHSTLQLLRNAIPENNPKHPYSKGFFEDGNNGTCVPTLVRCGPSGLPCSKIYGASCPHPQAIQIASSVRNPPQSPSSYGTAQPARISNELSINRGNQKPVLGRGTTPLGSTNAMHKYSPMQRLPRNNAAQQTFQPGILRASEKPVALSPLCSQPINSAAHNGVDHNGNSSGQSRPALNWNSTFTGLQATHQINSPATRVIGRANANLIATKTVPLTFQSIINAKPTRVSSRAPQQVEVRMKRTYPTRDKQDECRDIARTNISVPVATLPRKSQWNMAACLVCLTTGGGVPLFTRKTSDFKSLPFPIIGSLNGVHMFTKSHNATLLSATTKETKIVWRDYYDSVTLIILTDNDNACDSHLYEFLENVFYAMVFFIGIDDIVNLKNVERLKRDLRSCYSIIDALLTHLVEPNPDLPLVGDLIYGVDCLLCTESMALQGFLDSFVESAYSTYGCLLVNGRVVVASKKWWTLNGKEMALLSLYLSTSQQATCRDVPIFLPVGSPKVPHRLLVFQLVQGVEVCTLCGDTPTLTQLEKEVGRFWKGAYDTLKSTLQYRHHGFPNTIILDKSILGFILVNTEDNKCLCSVFPHGIPEEGHRQENSFLTSKQRLKILRSFSKMILGTIFNEDDAESVAGKTETCQFKSLLKHLCTESYVCCTTHKLYALRTEDHQIFILFSLVAPTFALRSVTYKTLQALTKGKHVRL